MRQITLGKGCVIEQERWWETETAGCILRGKTLALLLLMYIGGREGGSAVGIKENVVLAFCKSFVLFENCVEVNYIKQSSSSRVENSCLK